VTEAIGDAFAIEHVTAINQFLLEFLKFAGIESGDIWLEAVHGSSFLVD
jgi:hypothetical protein